MNKITNIKHFENMLLKEKTLLEGELVAITIGNTYDPCNPEVTSNNFGMSRSDDNEMADSFRQTMENAGIAERLSNHLSEIAQAIIRIKDGTYGKCNICGEPIETERLEAIPSACISIKHRHNK